MFSHHILGTAVQVLSSIRAEASTVILYKHLGYRPWPPGEMQFLQALEDAADNVTAAILIDIVSNAGSNRADAPTKYVYDERMADLRAWMGHDGLEIVDGNLILSAPAIPETGEVRDRIMELLSTSPLDEDGLIRKMLIEARNAFGDQPPDPNSAATKTRIALETIVRRAASPLANPTGTESSADTWGAALASLTKMKIISADEEVGIAAAYKFISPGSHIPKGLSDLEWTRLVRSIGLSICYFLLSRFSA
jgi:hypothetical protein